MTQQEFLSYRFSSGEEPTDEMLDQLMKNAARKARQSNQEALRRYFDALRRDCEALKANPHNPSPTQNSEKQ